jgi:Ca2+-binding EF-hand superfamily protein
MGLIEGLIGWLRRRVKPEPEAMDDEEFERLFEEMEEDAGDEGG